MARQPVRDLCPCRRCLVRAVLLLEPTGDLLRVADLLDPTRQITVACALGHIQAKSE